MAEPKRDTINVLVTSDIHGYVYPTNYRDKSTHPLGLSRLASLVKQKRSENRNVLLLDNGDAIQGSPSTYYHSTFQKNRSNPVIEAMNYLNYDAAAIGNHEFSFGLDYFQKAKSQSEFPWLSANIVNEQGKQPAFGKPYLIKDIGGIRIAILGITTHFISHWERPEHLEGIDMEEAVESAKKWVDHIRTEELPDLVIVSYHGGIERDLYTGIATEPATGENQAYQICREVAGIDILITGHQHRKVKAEVNGVTIVQPGCFGKTLGEVEIVMEETEKGWKVKSKTPKLTTVEEEHQPEKGMVNLLAEREQEVEEWLDQAIGSAEEGLQVTDPFQARLKDNPFIELVNKVQMQATGAAISCTPLFDNRSPGFSGDITIRDVIANYTYPNSLKVKRLSGYDIKQALEKSATYFHLSDDGDIEVDLDYLEPKGRPYIYDMWEGISYEINLSQPVGSRVAGLTHQGKSVIYDQYYNVVLNNYRAGGGGEYHMFINKPVIKTIQTSMIELLISYIQQNSPLKATCDHNWIVTK